jgi:hypothetical protein
MRFLINNVLVEFGGHILAHSQQITGFPLKQNVPFAINIPNYDKWIPLIYLHELEIRDTFICPFS